MSTNELPPSILASLDSVIALDRSLDEKGTVTPGEGLYPRDGAPSVSRIEELVSEVTIPGQQHNVIWASGMSAVRETVLFAVDYMANNGTRDGGNPTIARSLGLYSQSAVFFDKLTRSGIRVSGFSSDDFDTGRSTVLRALEERPTDVLFAETVANTPELSMLNVHRLLEHVRWMEKPPIVVLDNTLPLSTGLNFDELLEPDDPVFIVESGTKNLMNNSELLGISYSANLDLLAGLRRHRAHSGAVNSLSGLATINERLQKTIPGFHDRNRAVFGSTGKIAVALAEAQTELGTSTDFITTFPMTDTDHRNYEYAQQITPKGLTFISPVVFAVATGLSDQSAPDLLRRISEHPVMREQIKEGQVDLGQSFGLGNARLLYDRSVPNVRFAGGYNLADPDALAAAIKEAAADK
jgi:cystathionine beta-lyase/cystathionine gamma-synthase